jgi:hypothetical protein
MPHILSTGERKHLYRKRGHEVGREMNQINLAAWGHVLQRPKVAPYDDDDKVGFWYESQLPTIT